MIFTFDSTYISDTAMDKAQSDLLSRQRSVILGLLLALAAAAWAILVWTHADSNMEDMTTGSLTFGPRAPLFLVIWVVMMVAMMLPTAAPMILTFHKVQAANRQPRDAFVSTWVFAAAYLLVWAFAGLAAYVVMQARLRGPRSPRPLWPKSAAQSSWRRVFTSSPR